MGIEAVSHGSDRYPGDEDHHGEGDDAAVTGELSAPRGGCQLNLIDQGDHGDHDFTIGALLHCHWLGRLRGYQDLLYGLFGHFYSMSPSWVHRLDPGGLTRVEAVEEKTGDAS